MHTFYDTINSSLRATEEAIVVVDALILTNSGAGIPPSIETSDNWSNRRVLTVVSHKDEWALAEEGALFVYRFRPSLDSSVYSPELQTIYPIYGNFSILMSQMRRNTLDLTVADTKAILDQPRSGFSLNITPAEGQSSQRAITFYATDVKHIALLSTECKRLKKAAEVENPDAVKISRSTSHFSWLRPYVFQRIHLPFLSVIPPDLRTINKPLIERLSAASAGNSGDDAMDIQVIRDEWIKSKTRLLVRKGTRSLSLRVGTFNVNGKMPSQDLSSWIQGSTASTLDTSKGVVPPSPQIKALSSISGAEDVSKTNESQSTLNSITSSASTARPVKEDPDPDIIALGFQELDLSTEALIYSTGTAREDAWCLAIFAALGEKAVQYEKLASEQLVGMLIVILVKKSLKDCFGDIQTTSVGSGILGLMGNKGATAVRLTFMPPLDAGDKPESPTSIEESEGDHDNNKAAALTLTFVNAHLAAFDEMVDRRNEEFHELSRRLRFTKYPSQVKNGVYEDYFGAHETPSAVNLYETDALFWFGDLNYRVDIPDPEFRRFLAEREWGNRLEVLIRYDQLKKSMLSGKAFNGFLEHRIAHLPTYRFSSGFGMDEFGYDQKRRPAWTDRILHFSNPFCNLKQKSYDSYPQITMSDHRPAAADFSIDFELYERSEYEFTAGHLYREVSEMEGSHDRPTVKVDKSFLDFGQIRFNSRQTKKIVIENVGKIPCAWRFVAAQPDTPTHPGWLTIEPEAGMFLPGEKMEISMTLHVGKPLSPSLNLGPRDMSGTLILHTILGKDHFIAISGEYLPSCFGNKLETLIRLPGPIRTVKSPKELRPENHPLNAPGEIMRLVNRLMSNALQPEDLFLQSPDEELVTTIRECLDTGDEFPWPLGKTENDARISHAFAHALIQLLDSLIEPIVPPMLHSRCVQMTGRDEAFELLDALRPAAVNVWITVTAFLHFLCQSLKASGYAEKIADIFVAVLMRDDPETLAPPISPIGKRKFFLQFIT